MEDLLPFIERYQQRDEVAFEQLVGKLHDLMQANAWKSASSSKCGLDDRDFYAAQLVTLWRVCQKKHITGNAYIVSSLHRACIDLGKQIARYKKQDTAGYSMRQAVTSQSAEYMAVGNLMAKDLQTAVDNLLPPSWQKIINLRRGDLHMSEIAEILGISIGTVKSSLNAIRTKLPIRSQVWREVAPRELKTGS